MQPHSRSPSPRHLPIQHFLCAPSWPDRWNCYWLGVGTTYDSAATRHVKILLIGNRPQRQGFTQRTADSDGSFEQFKGPKPPSGYPTHAVWHTYRGFIRQSQAIVCTPLCTYLYLSWRVGIAVVLVCLQKCFWCIFKSTGRYGIASRTEGWNWILLLIIVTTVRPIWYLSSQLERFQHWPLGSPSLPSVDPLKYIHLSPLLAWIHIRGL